MEQKLYLLQVQVSHQKSLLNFQQENIMYKYGLEYLKIVQARFLVGVTKSCMFKINIIPPMIPANIR